jgi:hypothetical protein
MSDLHMITQAADTASERGHKLSHWRRESPRVSEAECLHCGRTVQVIAFPQPNEIAISGEAVALNCTRLSEHQHTLARDLRAQLCATLRRKVLHHMVVAQDQVFEDDPAACREAVERAIAYRDTERQVLGWSDERVLVEYLNYRLPVQAA